MKQRVICFILKGHFLSAHIFALLPLKEKTIKITKLPSFFLSIFRTFVRRNEHIKLLLLKKRIVTLSNSAPADWPKLKFQRKKFIATK